MSSKTGLGKGLSALIPMSPDLMGDDDPIAEIELEKIQPNAFQPRRTFSEEKLEDLAASIKEHGVVQPIVVRKIENGKYELVVGERRVRACKKLGLKKIPAVIKEFSNEQMMEIALVENIQRQDLNPVEEARAYKRLMEEFKMTQEQVAIRVSKSRPLIANMVRLLNLPEDVLNMLSEDKLTIGHVRPLLSLENTVLQIKLAEEILTKELTVRDTEALVKNIVEKKPPSEIKKKRKEDKPEPELIDIENKLRDVCGTKVIIKNNGEKGRIEIEYYNNDDLDRIISLILKDENILYSHT